MKDRARQQTNAAIANGTLVRGLCEECGGCPVEAHHEDYAQPLAVTWLCREHHLARHGKKLRERPAEVGLLGEMLERRRHALGLSKSELAFRLGVSRRTVQAWEEGSVPQPRHRRALTEFFSADAPEEMAS